MYRPSLPVAGARFGNWLPEHGLATGCRNTVWQPDGTCWWQHRPGNAFGCVRPSLSGCLSCPVFYLSRQLLDFGSSEKERNDALTNPLMTLTV